MLLRFFFFHLIGWLFLNNGYLPIPDFIPNTPINISGLYLWIISIFIWVKFIQVSFRNGCLLTIKDAVLNALILTFIAESLFQLLRVFSINDLSTSERGYLYFRSLIFSTLFGGVVAYLTAVKMLSKSSKPFFISISILLFAAYMYAKYFR